jgi:hypothetical protein
MMLTRAVTRCQRGMCTAEYAVGTVAACGFACVLFRLLPAWRGLLTDILKNVLAVRFGWPFSGLPW